MTTVAPARKGHMHVNRKGDETPAHTDVGLDEQF